ALNSEGPVTKSFEQWQEWWRKQVQGARQDAAAIANLQRSTGGGRATGFHGRVRQLTGTLRLTGMRPLDYQQDDAPTAPMEVGAEYGGGRHTLDVRGRVSRRQLQPPRFLLHHQ
ncbi:hypothetical protein MTO96_047299, partial [Rhipicephalus appendiculatus]